MSVPGQPIRAHSPTHEKGIIMDPQWIIVVELLIILVLLVVKR